MIPPLRLVFAGTPDFAAAHLQALLDDGRHQVVAVYTQPDRPAVRGKKPRPSPVKTLAGEAGIEVRQPATFRDVDARHALAALQPDLMVVVAYGLILPQAVLDIPTLGCINVHASLLPRWRGAAPIQRAIEAGDTETGVTIMQMDAGLDTGNMLLTAKCPITAETTAGSLHSQLATLGGPTLCRAVEQLALGEARPVPQDEQRSCYAHKIDKAEAALDWRRSAVELDRKIRAFNPVPCCHSSLEGQRVRIWQARPLPSDPATPGVIQWADRQGIGVACGEGALCLEVLQLPGGRAMTAGELLNSKADLFAVGARMGAE